MRPLPSDRLSLPIRWPVVAALLTALGVLLVGLGTVDRARSRAQLAALQTEFCNAQLPEGLLDQLDRIGWETALSDDKALASRFSALHSSNSVRTFYQKDNHLWHLTSWYGAASVSATDIPADLGPWERPWQQPGCRATKSGNRLIVGRQLHTTRRTPVLLVLDIQRSPEVFD